jgi:ADP-heptose:LPS heptosyltransferase
MSSPPLRRAGIRSVAVFRALHLGDMLCAVPALRALRAAVPEAHIALVGLPSAAQLASRYGGCLDEFIAFPGHPDLPEQPVRHEGLADFYARMRSREFSLALQLHGSGEISNAVVAAFGARDNAGHVPPGRPQRLPMHALPYPDRGAEPLRMIRLLRWLGAPVRSCALDFPLLPEDWDELRRSGLARGLRRGGYICVHPGARTRGKCWPARRFAEVADSLSARCGLPIVLTGSAGEADLAATAAVAGCMRAPAVNTAGPLSIGAMAALMSGARLLICNDTGVSHIAAGLRLPSVVVFGTADMLRWAPIDRVLHRCIRDPDGSQGPLVLEHALALLSLSRRDGTAPAPAP